MIITTEQRKSIPRGLILAFVVFSMAIIAFGTLYYQSQRDRIFKSSQDDLAVIARLKISQIEQWHAERMGYAGIISQDRPLLMQIRRYFENEQLPGVRVGLVKWMEEVSRSFDYNAVALVDTGSVIRLSVSHSDPVLTTRIREDLARVIREKEILMTDLHRAGDQQSAHLDLMIPLVESGIPGTRAFGAMILRIDPGKVLFPLIQSWPTPSKSSETLLLVRKGDSVVFLNQLRHIHNSPLDMRLPMSDTEILGVKAVRGITGLAEGLDYRRIPVVGYLSGIPGLPWYMVAKVDKSELMAPVKKYLFFSILVVLLLILTTASIAGFSLYGQRIRFYRLQLHEQQAISELESKFSTAFNLSPVSITITSIADNKFIDVNQTFLEIMEYERTDVIGKTPLELRMWPDENERSWLVAELKEKGRLNQKVLGFRSRSGKLIDGLAAMSIVTINGQPCILSTVVDITERKKTEEKFQQQYFTLNGIIESSPEPIYSLDSLYRYTSFNKSHSDVMLALCGAAIKPGQSMLDFINTEMDRVAVKANIDRALAGEHFAESAWSGNDPETRRYSHVVHNPVRNDQDQVIGVAVMVHDLTDWKGAEEALKTSEEKFSVAFMTSHYAITITKPDDGTFIEVNDGFIGMTGYTRAETIKNSEVGLDLWFDPQVRKKVVRELLRGGTVTGREYRFRRKNGEILIGLFSAHLITILDKVYIISSINDITDRRLSLELLRLKNLVFDASIAANSIADINGLITEVNEAFLRTWGYPTRVDVLGKSLEHFILEQSKGDAIVKELKTAGVWEGDYIARRKDGSTFIAHGLATNLTDTDGNHIGFQSSVMDVTARQEAENEIRKLNEELEKRVVQRTEQLAMANKELEAFSYSVSHDLRAPLRTIHGFSRILLEDYGDKLDAEAKRICEVITAGSVQMGEFIDDLLNFSRVGRSSLNPMLLEMRTLALSVFHEQASESDKERINLRVQDLHPVYGDHGLMRVVWSNLISNAIKYSSKKDLAEISIGSMEEGDQVVYFVQDNGVGFDMTYRHKLFSVFQRLHTLSEFEGNGVGLAIIKRIVTRHGGWVKAVGETGRGATFYFSLPAGGWQEEGKESGPVSFVQKPSSNS